MKQRWAGIFAIALAGLISLWFVMPSACQAGAYISGTYKNYRGNTPYVVNAAKVHLQHRGKIVDVRNDSGADTCVLLYSADGKTITTEQVGIPIATLKGRIMEVGWYKIHPLPNRFDSCYDGCYMGISVADL